MVIRTPFMKHPLGATQKKLRDIYRELQEGTFKPRKMSHKRTLLRAARVSDKMSHVKSVHTE